MSWEGACMILLDCALKDPMEKRPIQGYGSGRGWELHWMKTQKILKIKEIVISELVCCIRKQGGKEYILFFWS